MSFCGPALQVETKTVIIELRDMSLPAAMLTCAERQQDARQDCRTHGAAAGLLLRSVYVAGWLDWTKSLAAQN